jgi:hypothetical protein
MAGAKPMGMVAVIHEWAQDYNRPDRAAVAGLLAQRAGNGDY